MAEPPLPDLPVGHIILMIYTWPCMIVYVIILLIIVVRRQKVKLFRASFFTLTLYQSIPDLLTFLHVELVLRARKYRYFGWNAIEQAPEWFPEFSFVLTSAVQSVVYFGYLNLALCRYSILAHPLTHELFWSHTNIVLICLAEWTFSIAAPLIMLRFNADPIRFVFRANGVLGVESYSFQIFHASSGFILNLIVLIVCGISYRKTKLTLKTKLISAHASIHDLERRLFIFSIVTFMPLLLDMGRSSLMAFAVFTKNTSLLLIGTDLWFYMAEIVITMPMWTLVLASKKIREELFQQLTSLLFSKRCSGVEVISY